MERTRNDEKHHGILNLFLASSAALCLATFGLTPSIAFASSDDHSGTPSLGDNDQDDVADHGDSDNDDDHGDHDDDDDDDDHGDPGGSSSTCGSGNGSQIIIKAIVRDFKDDVDDDDHGDDDHADDDDHGDDDDDGDDDDHGFNGFAPFNNDMGLSGASGYAHGNIDLTLDSDGKPSFNGLGNRVATPWTYNDGRGIESRFFDLLQGDLPGANGAAYDAGISSQGTFATWFRTIPGINAAAATSLRLAYDAFSGTFVFDDQTATPWANKGGFYPVDSKLYGDDDNDGHNGNFSMEFTVKFTYHAGAGEFFSYRGDDDVMVFIDNQLMIDLEASGKANNETVQLDRMAGLVDNGQYELKFFLARRESDDRRMRIQTNLCVKSSATLPNTLAMYD